MKNYKQWSLLVLIYLFVLIGLSRTSSTITYVRAEEIDLPESFMAEVSAYTSSEDETDDTPFLTASGETTGQGTIACPTRLKFGTLIQIEGRIYKCNDRMAKRFRNSSNFDIWFPEKESALAFGRQRIAVFILNVVE